MPDQDYPKNYQNDYRTRFIGKLKIEPDLTPDQIRYLRAFGASRRCCFNRNVIQGTPDPTRVGAGLPLGGPDCAYYVGGGVRPQGPSVKDYDRPPHEQPGLWCDWRACECGSSIMWNGNCDAQDMPEWLRYLIDHFLEPWMRRVSGQVLWFGDDDNDRGKIVTYENNVKVIRGPLDETANWR